MPALTQMGDPTVLVDGSSWAQTTRLAMIEHGGTINDGFVQNLQWTIPVTGLTQPYEKAGMLIQVQTADPSSAFNHDAVGFDGRAMIAPANMTGRVWGLYGGGFVLAGGDGMAIGAELAAMNYGTDQPAVDTTTSKYGAHLVSGGTVNATAAAMISAGASRWHKGVYANASSLVTLANDVNASFLELGGLFKVRSDGTMTVTPSNAAQPQVLFSDTSNAQGLVLRLTGNGATTPSKNIRVTYGVFQILNHAMSAAVMQVDDAGNMAVGGQLNIGARPAFATGSKYLVIDASGNVQVSAIGPAS